MGQWDSYFVIEILLRKKGFVSKCSYLLYSIIVLIRCRSVGDTWDKSGLVGRRLGDKG